MPDSRSVVILNVDLKGYHFGLSDILASQFGLTTDQSIEVRYGNTVWPGKVLVIRNLPPGNDNRFFINPILIPDPKPPDNTGFSLLTGMRGKFRLGPVLGILSHRTGKPLRLFGEQSSFLKKLIRAGRSMNILVFVFSPAEVNWKPGLIYGYTLTGTGGEETWRQGIYPLPDVIYDRGLFPPGDYRRAATEFRKKMRAAAAGRYFNPAFFGKWKTHRWFMEHPTLRLHLPETVLAEKDNDVTGMIERHPEVYLKPVGGSSGRGIIKITRQTDDKYSYERRIKGRPERSQELSTAELITILRPTLVKRKHIVQEGIRLAKYMGRTFDIRALVQKDGSGRWSLTGLAARVAAPNAFITNVHAGGKAEKVSTALGEAFSFNSQLQEIILSGLQHLSLLACSWIEQRTGQKFGEIAVDLGVATDGRVWLIELNAVPGRTVFRRIGAPAVADRALTRPLEYTRFLTGCTNSGLTI